MNKFLSYALVVVLSIMFNACNRQPSIDRQARNFASSDGDYVCDLLYDSIDIDVLFLGEYINRLSNDELESLCANNDGQYILYDGASEIARSCADYYNALIMLHNLSSDNETSYRFGENDDAVYARIADSVMLLDCSIIRNDTVRRYVQEARNSMSDLVRYRHPDSGEKVEKAFDRAYGFLLDKVNPVLEKTAKTYEAFVNRDGYFDDFDSICDKRGLFDKVYQQHLLTNMYLAETPAERHVCAIEFAHSDSANAYFLVGAAVLQRELEDKPQYSPYLIEMWKTWRAIASTITGASTWAYIPNLVYNRERTLIAKTILHHIEAHPTDSLAQGVLIELAGKDNISRFGSLYGNAAIMEQMSMFPEWNKRHIK